MILIAFSIRVQAQTWFEPAASDVYSPTKLQKSIRTSTDVALVALPVATIAGVLIAGDKEGFIQGLEVAGGTVATTFLLKWITNERRPDGSNMHSFPSGHTSFTFAAASFLQRRYGWKFGVPAYAIATYVAWGRVYSKRHHVWDAVAGAAIGAGFAYLFTTPFVKKHNVALSPISSPGSIGIYASMDF